MKQKKKTRLRKVKLTSVDMVRRGANQEAHINLYKSANDPDPPQDPTQDPTEDLEKTETFDDGMTDNRLRYQEALNKSIVSIMNDSSLSEEGKTELIGKSIEQFATKYETMYEQMVKATVNKSNPETPIAVGTTQDDEPDETEEGDRKMKIDKSRFTPEELVQYNALIAKGKVEEEEEGYLPAEEEEEEEMEKSAEMHPEVRKALDEMKVLQKNMEMKELAEIAKKYTILGKKEDELTATLYDMKKSSPASYDAYIAVLDQNLELVNKSGQFEEIGKSGSGMTGGSTEAKIEGIAKGYMDKDPNMDHATAVLKAWENHPELMDEYDANY